MAMERPIVGAFIFIITTVFIVVIVYLPRNRLPKEAQCNGTLQNPNNTTFYYQKPVNPKTLPDELSILYNRYHTVIFDCPETVVFPSREYTIHSVAFMKVLSAFNQAHNPPINFWLRLDKQEDANADISFCADFVRLGNTISQGTFRGIMGSSEILVAYASGKAKQLNSYYYSFGQPPCKWYSEECFEHLKVLDIELGLMLNSANCRAFPLLVPHSVIQRFKEISYFQEEPSQMSGGDSFPTLTVSNNFTYCKNLFAGSVPKAKEIKYGIREKYEAHFSWNMYPFPYCLKFV